MRSIAKALILLFLVSNGMWIAKDNLVRDGDEEGHVGAAELFLFDLNQGQYGHALHRAFVADMGDYPSLYPSIVGSWWWIQGGGDPGRLLVRGINLGFLLLASWGVYLIAARSCTRDLALLAAALSMFAPLSLGAARHFMPEGALAAAVALTIAAAVNQRRSPTPKSALLLGLAIAAGMLTKQTFPLYVAIPVIVTIRWRISILWTAATLVGALPWYISNFSHQLKYTSSSAEYMGGGSLLSHLFYYPAALISHSYGPVWALFIVICLLAALKGSQRKLAVTGLVWILGGILLLTLVPKKYERLAVPLLPACGLIIAAGLAARPKLLRLTPLPVAWSLWVSFGATVQPPSPIADFEPGCLQVWIRTPQTASMGFEPIVAVSQDAVVYNVRVIDGPQIPCEVQTTFDWEYHLGPHLRRAGVDPSPNGVGELVIDFRDDDHEVPLLNESYSAHFTLFSGEEN